MTVPDILPVLSTLPMHVGGGGNDIYHQSVANSELARFTTLNEVVDIH